MTFEKLNEIFTSDFNIDTIVSARQTHNAGARFNRADRPRSSHGLFLLADYPATYDFLDGTYLHANPGDVLLLPKGARYICNFGAPDGKVSHPLLINFRLTDPEGNEVPLGDRVLRLCRDSGSLQPLFTAATQLYLSAAPAKLKAKVYEVFGAIFPLADTDECCLGYISRHYTDKLSIPALAQKCAMSETAYRKRFRQLTGVSPVQYITGLKIEKACQMLRSGDISPGQISDFLNFYSLPYFYKIFKEHTGLTPHEYRDKATRE